MSDVAAEPPICLDASFAVALPISEPTSPAARALWGEWLRKERAFWVPPHFGAELVSAICRAGVQNRVTADEEADAIGIALKRVLPNVTVCRVTDAIWRAAWAQARELRRAGIYDTLYLAVAESLGAEFWTTDANLIRCLTADGRPLPAWVHLIEPEQS